jgi:DNA polymerase-3 subunit delta'
MNSNLWKKLIVQERVKSALEKIYYRNSYPPAIIFLGQKGVGKEAHAFAFAQSVNCLSYSFEPCGECEKCKRIADFLTPDVYFIFPFPTGVSDKPSFYKKVEQLLEKKKVNPYLKIQLPKANEITIDLIRELKSNLAISTPEIRKRFVIISQAEKLNTESQNALLKILEEPREDILFILETHNLEPILPTIRSRCWIINFSPLSNEDVKKYLTYRFGEKVSEEVFKEICLNFNGENISELIEELLEIIQSENFDEITENLSHKKPDFIELFRYLYLSNFYRAINYLEQFDILSDRTEAARFFQELVKFSYLVLKTKISQEAKEPELIKLSYVIDTDQFKKVIDYLNTARNSADNYINLNLLFIKLFILIKNSFIKK